MSGVAVHGVAFVPRVFAGLKTCTLLAICSGFFCSAALAERADASTAHMSVQEGYSQQDGMLFCHKAQGWLDVSPQLLDFVYELLQKNEEWSADERHFLQSLYKNGFGDSLHVLLKKVAANKR